MTILEEIVAYKKKEVETSKKAVTLQELEKSEYFNRPTHSLKEFIIRHDKSGIITEFKRQSPSKGIINDQADVEAVTKGYVQAGASALSVLTDTKFFGGSNNDLTSARSANEVPILRKDFIVDDYQIYEAKSIGADAILLIAACLTKPEAMHFAKLAKSLHLEVLMEIHNEQELEMVNSYLDVVGVNNRNLKTFEVSLDTSKHLSAKIPGEFVKISESGIGHPKQIIELKQEGFQGFLIGENFMRTENPAMAFREFMELLQEVK
ncbi:MAG: indole-3-glycerol phosphate synthase TrpC [Bacteroidetes bacterium]|jgi:indole-3-glycerol phosphate synthase|nr:indole-3-glycerol phosphate synthase TrpC [Bacteroidota bacterium]